MENVTMILKLLCGVALFLYGMGEMGDGLKKVAGNQLELILYRLTNSPWKGFLLGTGVTSVIQSSSATTVMVVGFVNSGMMKVSQAIGVILGAQIGTSITGWIICLSYIDAGSGMAALFSSATLTAVVAVIGILFRMFAKKDTLTHLGAIMLGFAVLMTGMSMMSGAVEPLRSNPVFISMMTSLTNPILGILFGIAFAAVLQSVSASVGVLQALSITGAITFQSAYPIILGMGIGASTPILLSAIGASRDGKRTALVYLLADMFGMCLGCICLPLVSGIGLNSIVMNPFSTAALNSVYRIIVMIFLLPFVHWIEKLIYKVIPVTQDEKENTANFDLLEERFLSNPDVAYEQSMSVMADMANDTKKNVNRAISLLETFDEHNYTRTKELESTLNKYEDKLGNYLVKLMSAGVSLEQSKMINKSLQAISDFEKISDYALDLAHVTRHMHSQKRTFSKDANDELAIIARATEEIIDITVTGFLNNDSRLIKSVFPLREVITVNCNTEKKRHVLRIKSGKCDQSKGYELYDILNDMLRIGEHCASLALDVIKEAEQDFNVHRFLHKYEEQNKEYYRELLHHFEKTYTLELNSQA